MSGQSNGISCQTGCWGLAAGVGFITFLMLLVVGSTGWIGSIFLAGVAFIVLGFLFSWMFCTPLTRPGEVKLGSANGPKTPGTAGVAPGSAGASSAAGGASGNDQPAAPASAVGAKAAASQPDVHAAPASADAEAGVKVKPSKDLPGQKELSDRKGNWKYGADEDTKKPTAASGGQAIATGASAGADAEARTAASLDPDAPQKKPEALDGPRGGSADNLKEIKGVGPKLEKVLNELGFYHFDQIAGWSDDEVNWVNQNLTGFRGRVTRDNWVEQAKVLASGGETEFSKRVDKGDVY